MALPLQNFPTAVQSAQVNPSFYLLRRECLLALSLLRNNQHGSFPALQEREPLRQLLGQSTNKAIDIRCKHIRRAALSALVLGLQKIVQCN
jgi:hypothetical protein